MNVSDYIIHFLTQKKVDTIFMITGGQAMFLNDAVCRSKKIKYICNHHEQAVGMAAEAYGRISGKLGVALVTAGPASVNVMNGVVGAWVDSSPMLVLSGQSPLTFVQYQQKHKIRQYGIQGINIKPLVESITKFFVTVDDPSLIQYYVQNAYYLAFNGRPGP
ncbi:MAG TPA: thiamine pyrophosphate-binding protein, partial [Patescibacteria group bacterium]|nr:thiamine pyrophosphate-binding protein [Patescibacteria group bacterium]